MSKTTRGKSGQKGLDDLSPEAQKNILAINAAASIIRREISGKLGMDFDGDRDLYTAVGYKRELDFSDYYALYKRLGVAQRIVTAPVDSTWVGKPQLVIPTKGKETKGDKGATSPGSDSWFTRWNAVVAKTNLWHYCNRVDTLAGLGEYAVLFLGFSGDSDTEKPVDQAADLLYVSVYAQANATITELVTDSADSRYGKPLMYELTPVVSGEKERRSKGTKKMGASAGAAFKAHWTRVLHVAEGLLEDEVYGTPRMEPVYDNLKNIQKEALAAAEMFWAGAWGGKAFVANGPVGTQSLDDMQEEIDEYYHKMRRFIRLTGMDVKDLSSSVPNSGPIIDAELKLISAGTHIPLRILTGSERGELASTSDDDNWVTFINERRMKFAEPQIVRELVERLSSVGVIAAPPDDYAVEWPKLTHVNKKETADIAVAKTNALTAYVAGGANVLLPEDWFLRDVMGYDEDQVEEIMKAAEVRAEEIAADEAEATKMQAEVQAKALAAAGGTGTPVTSVGGNTGKGQRPLQSGASRQQAMGKKVAPAIADAATGPKAAPLSQK